MAEAYLIGLLTYLTSLNKQTSFANWESFYLDTRRAVNRCNFALPFVKTTGALSSNNGKPSKLIATNCFIDFFNSPNNLNGQIFTDFIQGIGGSFTIEAYKLTTTGRIDKKSKIEQQIPYASGLLPFDLSPGGITRDVILIKPDSSNLYIQSVSDFNHKPTVEFKQALTRKGENIGSLGNNYEVDIIYMAYGGDTRRQTQIRLDK